MKEEYSVEEVVDLFRRLYREGFISKRLVWAIFKDEPHVAQIRGPRKGLKDLRIPADAYSRIKREMRSPKGLVRLMPDGRKVCIQG